MPNGQGFALVGLCNLVDEVVGQLGLPPVVPMFDERLPEHVQLSDHAMELILLELFGNSKKFHPRNRPQMQLRARLSGDRVVIEVEDDGVSLTPEQLQRAVQPYYQAERRFTGQVEGMGLGLSLVCSMAWEVGGDCTVRNRLDGDGLVVELRLPIGDQGRALVGSSYS